MRQNKYLNKIAALTEADKKDIKDLRTGLSGAGALYGAGMIDTQYRRGHLTGREILYHGTSRDIAKKIRKEGLKPQSETRTTTGATQAAVERGANKKLKDLNKGLVFTAKTRGVAGNYLYQEAFKGNRPGMVTISAPTWRDKAVFNKVENPEVALHKNSILLPTQRRALEEGLGRRTFVNKGEIPTRYIRGSKDYQKLTMSELKDFVSKNKKRAAKGYGKSLVGATLMGAGSKYVYEGLKKDKKNV